MLTQALTNVDFAELVMDFMNTGIKKTNEKVFSYRLCIQTEKPRKSGAENQNKVY